MPLDNMTEDREHQCLKVFGDEDFCSCVNSTLAAGLSFQDYVNVLMTSKDAINYEGLSPDNKKLVDSVLRTRKHCIEE